GVGFAVGIGLLTGLFAWRGIDTVADLLLEAGAAILLVCLLDPPAQAVSAASWRRLFPPGRRPGRWRIFLASWMGSAVNSLLPVATIGGEIVKARVLILWSHPGVETAAAMVVDKTVQAVAVLLWGLIGAAILVAVVGASEIALGVLVGAAVLSAGIAGFIAVQVTGGFTAVARRVARFVDANGELALVENAEAMEGAMREIYCHPARLAWSTALRLAERMLLVGEIVLVAHLMGVPIGLVDAVILKGVIGAIRGMSFAVPGGLGVQEGGYVAIGALLGMSPDLMIAVSLATRVREIVPSVPIILLWQGVEGRALWRRAGKTAP
ncbi:MAG: lysylphosphatidylglycerol synthase domain-containing protein, partial [Rhodospirillales bacterium]